MLSSDSLLPKDANADPTPHDVRSGRAPSWGETGFELCVTLVPLKGGEKYICGGVFREMAGAVRVPPAAQKVNGEDSAPVGVPNLADLERLRPVIKSGRGVSVCWAWACPGRRPRA